MAPAPGEIGKPLVARYWGETGRNAYTRGQDYLRALRNNDKSYAVVKHRTDYHGGDPAVEYKMGVLSLHKDVLGRLAREGTNMVSGMEEVLLNSKLEFKQGVVPQTRTKRCIGK